MPAYKNFVSIAMALEVLLVCSNASVQAATFIVSNSNDNGVGSLRQAITEANTAFAADNEANVIVFRIGRGAATIQPVTPLPVISGHVTINGATQPGFSGAPLVEISGASAPAGSVGLDFRVPDNAALGSTVKDLVINRFPRFTGIGIRIGGKSARVRLFNCYIGTTRDGRSVAGNGTGVLIEDQTTHCSIGGSGPREGNLISGNFQGVRISGSAIGPNTVQGNLIGTDVSGMRALEGANVGVAISLAALQTIGGTKPGARNVISGNVTGVSVGGDKNVVEGNYIGLSRDGSGAVANKVDGVEIISSSGNRIGGASPNSRNVISGNAGSGVSLAGPFDAECRANVMQGNYIGVSPDGKRPLWNGGQGITIGMADENLIGGETPGAGNVISSAREGIWISGGTIISGTRTRINSTKNRVIGNLIGVGIDGNHLGCGSHGVELEGATNNVVGGTGSGQANIIAFNNGDGIVVRSLNDSNEPPATRGNSLRGNSIFRNAGKSINLQPLNEEDGTSTPNDIQAKPFDADEGPNDLQNAPQFTGHGSTGYDYEASGFLQSTPNTKFVIDFYQTEGLNLEGEIENHIDQRTIITNAEGIARFDYRFGFRYAGYTISMTATDAAGNTSEVSGCFNSGCPMYLDNVIHLNAVTYSINENSGPLEITIVREGGYNEDIVSYSTSSISAASPSDFRDSQGTVRFAPGQRIAKVLVPIANDGRSEGDEVFQFSLRDSLYGAYIGEPNLATITIIDDDLVSGSDASAQEGSD